MLRAIALTIALMLTGTPAALACVGSCVASLQASDVECRHHAPAPGGLNIGAASEECATPLAETPFLVETVRRAPRVSATPVALVATTAGHVLAADSADTRVSVDSPPDRSPRPHTFSTVLRI